jgi:2,3-bisphosphoglycerate-independent phosphoglycerate mutase
MTSRADRPRPIVLVVVDGFGLGPDPAADAISAASMPRWRALQATWPHCRLEASGEAVGLPAGQMGNSEVGHLNLGAGRPVLQDLPRIDAEIADGAFGRNPTLLAAVRQAAGPGRRLHLVGLVGPGGVHSMDAHAVAVAAMARDAGVTDLVVHGLLDGRDTPPRSADAFIPDLERRLRLAHLGARLALIGGRYYGMDRDNRWDRTKAWYDAMVHGRGFGTQPAISASDALAAAYARGENDEFVKPTVIADGAKITDGDAVVFMNFRADRARELSHAFVDADFTGFARPRRIGLSAFVSLTDYEKGLAVSAIAYPAQSMRNSLGEYLASLGLSQLRIAETEKYAHVTFFFSGGREAPFDREERILVPSPHVATYDLKPEMSCPEVTEKLVEAIASKRFDFIVCNLANADMVGHTGIEPAAIRAAEAIDAALGRIEKAIRAAGGEMLISADHGNLEEMLDANGVPHTQHTVGPVPLVYVGRKATLHHGALRDLAPTVLALMDLPKPAEMTGQSLVEFAA